MQKRFVTTLIFCLVLVLGAIGFVACESDGTTDSDSGSASSVAGKTYVFEKAEITKGLSGEEKTFMESMMNEAFEGDTLSFTDTAFESDMFGSGTYTQKGSKVTVTAYDETMEWSVSKDRISCTQSEKNPETGKTMSAKFTYKLSSRTPDQDGDKDDDKNQGGDKEDDKNQGGTQTPASVAGKKYKFQKIELSATGISDAEKEEMEEFMTQSFQGSTISFTSETAFGMTMSGVTRTGTYTKNANSLTLTLEGVSQEFTLSGDTISSTESETDNGVTVSMKITYKLSDGKNESDGDKEDDKNQGGTQTPNSVAGKTYVFDKYEISGDDITDEQKKLAEDNFNKYYGGATLTFSATTVEERIPNMDTSATASYTQKGNTIIVEYQGNSDEWTIQGDMIYMSFTFDGTTQKQIYKLVK